MWECTTCGSGEYRYAAQPDLHELRVHAPDVTVGADAQLVALAARVVAPAPHMVHGMSSAPSARCTAWACISCGAVAHCSDSTKPHEMERTSGTDSSWEKRTAKSYSLLGHSEGEAEGWGGAEAEG